MSRKKQGQKIATRKDDNDYPFGTGHWAKWTNVERLAWMRNFRDKLRDKYKDKLNVSDKEIAQLNTDVAALERVVAYEQTQPEFQPGWEDQPPREKLRLKRAWLDELCASGNAAEIGYTFAVIKQHRDAMDKYERDIAAWEKDAAARRQFEARKKLALLGLAQDMDSAGDAILDRLDATNTKAIFLPPDKKFGKKGN